MLFLSLSTMDLHYFAIYKPFGTISQFSEEGHHATLGELFHFPNNVYPVGRLDTDSEGLLLLTNDKTINKRLLHPSNHHEKTYWVQVEGAITDEALEQLQSGVQIRIKKKDHLTAPAKAKRIALPNLPDRNPPIRYRASIPTSWIELTLTEGKNRQVRRMTAKVGFPTLRLIRASIEGITIEDVLPKAVVEMKRDEFLSKLKL